MIVYFRHFFTVEGKKVYLREQVLTGFESGFSVNWVTVQICTTNHLWHLCAAKLLLAFFLFLLICCLRHPPICILSQQIHSSFSHSLTLSFIHKHLFCISFTLRLSSVWPDLAKFHHFGKYLNIFGNIFKVYLVLAQCLCFWANFHCCKLPNIENKICSSGHTGHGCIEIVVLD